MSAKKWAILPSIISPRPRPEKKKLEMRTKIREKSLTPAGFEPTTSWLEHRRSTNWATRPSWVTLWSKYFITLFVTHAKTGWLGRSCLDLYYHCKHVKNTINHQVLKFTPLRLVSYMAVIYFGLYDVKCVYECQEVSNTALHNFPRPQTFRKEIRNENQDQRKIFDPGRIWTQDLRIRSPSL